MTTLPRLPDSAPRRGSVTTDLAGPAPWWRRHFLIKMLLIVAAAGDLANFYITVSLAFKADPSINIMLVTAVTASSLGVAHVIGASLRDHREGTKTQVKYSFLVMLATFWTLLGIGAFYIRGIAPTPASPDTGEQQFGSNATSTPTADTTTHWAAAAFLLFVYLASGGLAAWHAYQDHAPILQALRDAWRRLLRAGADNRHARGLVEHYAAMLRQSNDEGYRLERNYQAAVDHRIALAEECKHLVRVRIAASQGDPTDTNLLTSPNHTTTEQTQPTAST